MLPVCNDIFGIATNEVTKLLSHWTLAIQSWFSPDHFCLDMLISHCHIRSHCCFVGTQQHCKVMSYVAHSQRLYKVSLILIVLERKDWEIYPFQTWLQHLNLCICIGWQIMILVDFLVSNFMKYAKIFGNWKLNLFQATQLSATWKILSVLVCSQI